MSAPEWIDLQTASDLWDEVVAESGCNTDGDEMSAQFSAALAAGRFTARGIRHDGQTNAALLDRTEIPGLYFSTDIRSFRFGRVESWSGAQPIERWRLNRDYRVANPDWHDVYFLREPFFKWLSSAYPGGKKSTDIGKTDETPQPPAKKRGPAPKVDPQKFEKEAHRWIADNGMPDPEVDPQSRKADLEQHMLGFFDDIIGETRNRQLVTNAMNSYRKKMAEGSLI